jgi:hypothetical protein
LLDTYSLTARNVDECGVFIVVREGMTTSLPLDVLNLSTYPIQNDHDDNPSNELKAKADHRRGCSWLPSVTGEEGQAESTSFLASDRSNASFLGFANALQGTN